MEIRFNASRYEVPYYGQWLGEWAMQEDRMRAFTHSIAATDLHQHLSSSARDEAIEEAEDYCYSVVEGVAVISICGVMMKAVPSLTAGTSSVLAKRLVTRASRDMDVRGIVLKIDSPGGTVAGTMELADAVAACEKPTMAYCSDLTASAAYWVAAQCDSIKANEMAQVGSIGTYCVVEDWSSAYEKAGVKVHVIRAGQFKGAGAQGTEITEQDIAEGQRIIDGINAKFVQSVARGRGISLDKVAELADGRVHLAADAQSIGLIDGVSSWEEAFDQFAASLGGVQQSNSPALVPASQSDVEEDQMSNESKPATVAELKAAMPNAGADFILSCAEKGMTLMEAKSAYHDLLIARAEAREAAASRPGVKPSKLRRRGILAEDGMEEEPEAEDPMDEEIAEDLPEEEQEGEATARWNAALSRELRATNGNRMRAVSNVNRKYPGLRNRMLLEANTRAGRRHAVIGLR